VSPCSKFSGDSVLSGSIIFKNNKATNGTEEQASLSRNHEGVRKRLKAGGVNSRLCKAAN